MDPITIALMVLGLVSSIAGTFASVRTSRESEERARKHDVDIARLGQEIQDEQFQKQNVDFNSWANDKGHMIQAGVNPALMYGGMSPSVGFQSSSGASASASAVRPDLSALRSISPSELGSLAVADKNGQVVRERTKAETSYYHQKAAESLIDTIEKSRQNRFNKQMEQTIIDNAMADLMVKNEQGNYFRSLSGEADFRTERMREMLPAELSEIYSRIGINEQTRDNLIKEGTRLQNEIEREPLVRNKLRAEANQLNAAAHLARQNARLPEMQLKRLEEDLRTSQVQRLARECGLTGRRPGQTSKGKPGNLGSMSKNEQAFALALIHQGFTMDESLTAAYYYSFGSLQDLTSEWINAGSRILSGAAAGFGASKGLGGKSSSSGNWTTTPSR